MSWIETESLSFIARHEAEDTDYAQRPLDALEDLRLRMEERFDEVPGGITGIIHPTPGWLDAAHRFLPLARPPAAAPRRGGGWAAPLCPPRPGGRRRPPPADAFSPVGPWRRSCTT